ncbi:hypothetical protein R6Q57_025069 [Mikania cordata]
MQASDRFNINSQLEHLQAKYVGTGHADMNRFEWAVNIQRDSFASYVGHYPMLSYFAIAENESIGRERYNFMQVKCCCLVDFHRKEKMNEGLRGVWGFPSGVSSWGGCGGSWEVQSHLQNFKWTKHMERLK